MEIVLDGRAQRKQSVIAMGMFDGIHLAHQVLLMRAKVLAEQWKVPLIVVSFSDHPRKLINPARCPQRLQTLEEKCAMLEKKGVDLFFSMPFNQELIQMPAENFIGELIRRFHPLAFVCGYNHHFGVNGSGTPELLHIIGHALGFSTEIMPRITFGEQEISSTVIRNLLSEGRVTKACELLGRPYRVEYEIAMQDNQVCLTAKDSEKQKVGVGNYICLLEIDDVCVPAKVIINEIGEVLLNVSKRNKVDMSNSVIVHYIL